MQNDKNTAPATPSAPDKETARLHQGRNIVDGLSDAEVAKINQFQTAIDNVVRSLPEKQSLIAKRMQPVIRDGAHLSKIVAYSGADKRHVNLKILAALRYIYKIEKYNHGRSTSPTDRAVSTLWGCAMVGATAVYVGLGLAMDHWHNAWVIYPVVALVCAAITIFLRRNEID